MINLKGVTYVFLVTVALTFAQNFDDTGARPIPPGRAISAPQCNFTDTKPNPEMKKFIVKNENSTTVCMVVQLAAYLVVDGSHYVEFKNGAVNQLMSKCVEDDKQTSSASIIIDFECDNSIEIRVKHDKVTTYVQAINGHYKNNFTDNTFSNSTPRFQVNEPGHYYLCNSEQTIPVGKEKTLVFSNFALEAFRNTSGTDFYQIPEECTYDSQPVSNLVRVGVGICLVALVAIVLIAYFIGRRRWSERSSYESV